MYTHGRGMRSTVYNFDTLEREASKEYMVNDRSGSNNY